MLSFHKTFRIDQHSVTMSRGYIIARQGVLILSPNVSTMRLKSAAGSRNVSLNSMQSSSITGSIDKKQSPGDLGMRRKEKLGFGFSAGD